MISKKDERATDGGGGTDGPADAIKVSVRDGLRAPHHTGHGAQAAAVSTWQQEL